MAKILSEKPIPIAFMFTRQFSGSADFMALAEVGWFCRSAFTNFRNIKIVLIQCDQNEVVEQFAKVTDQWFADII